MFFLILYLIEVGEFGEFDCLVEVDSVKKEHGYDDEYI